MFAFTDDARGYIEAHALEIALIYASASDFARGTFLKSVIRNAEMKFISDCYFFATL